MLITKQLLTVNCSTTYVSIITIPVMLIISLIMAKPSTSGVRDDNNVNLSDEEQVILFSLINNTT